MNFLKRAFGVEYMLPQGMTASSLPSSRSMYNDYIRLAVPSVLEMVLISLIGMLITDISYGLIDPRVRVDK